MTRFHVLSALLLLCSWLAPSGGQEIGVEICHCAPNTYEFTLDFSLFCPPVNITIGDAVQATTCMVSPFGDPSVTDLIPVAVSSIDVLELNQNLQVMMQENIAGNFGDGDTFQYTSYAALPGEVVNPEDLPRALQININGINQFEEPIINVYLITFTNSCGSYPVLFEGQSAGWTRFSDLGQPNREFCPLVPSDAPTVAPDSPAPSPSPSASPTSIDPTPPPTPPPIPMSMSMSMSMNLRFGDLFDTMNDINQAAREFGRDPIVMDTIGIRGGRIKPRPRAGNNTPKRTRQAPPENMECDDYPCAAVNSATVDGSASSSKSSKTQKSAKSSKSSKNEKKDKTEAKKDTNKLAKSEKRRLAPLFDEFGREEVDADAKYTYGLRR